MHIEGVDPRDIRWEKVDPVYRVYFWHQPGVPVEDRREDVMYRCDEHRITGASDVHEVIAWAEQTAQPEQTYVLYVEHRDHGRRDELGLILLAGVDPTVPDESVTIRVIG